MKLRAVRVAEVGMFRSGVALEGLSGGLDVLAGPNEMGKSTLFRAIRTAFQLPHKSVKPEIKALQSTSGGAPLVEVDFEVDGKLWRLRKRFLSAPSAELRDIGGGAILRNADAETELVRLLSGHVNRSDLLGLVWVGQGESMSLPTGSVSLEAGLGRLIEEEIEDVGGGGQARRIRADIEKALEAFVSKKTRKTKVGTPYAAALSARDDAVRFLEQARETATASVARAAQLTDARTREAVLGHPVAVVARRDAVDSARTLLERGRLASERLQRFDVEVVNKQVAFDQAVQREAVLLSVITEEKTLQTRLAADRDIQSTTIQSAAQREAELIDLQTKRQSAQREVEQLRQELAALDQRDRCTDAVQRTAELEQHYARAQELVRRLFDINGRIAANTMTDQRYRSLRQAADTIDRLQARLSASAPRVRIDYLPGVAPCVVSADGIVAAGEEIAVPLALAFDIAGVGRLTVMAAAAADGSGESLANLQNSLAAELAASSVTDIAMAQHVHAARQVLAQEQVAVDAQLLAVAPQGIERLRDLRDASLTALQDLGPLPDADQQPGSREGVNHLLREAMQLLGRFDVEEQAAQRLLRETSNALASIVARLEAGETRLASVATDLPPAGERDAALEAARAAVAAQQAALHTAVLERRTFSDATPDGAALAGLEQALNAAETAKLEAERERQLLREEIKGLEVALARDWQDGVEASVAELQEALSSAQARVVALDREKDSLFLLELLLSEEAASRRTSLLKPVVDRLETYAGRVFPDARFTLIDQLTVTGMARLERHDDRERLSGGTREQIAVLVRMAYARLAADRGSALPLVLDDALVYSDDDRLGAMFEVLAQASNHHQVIVLTCHGRSFVPLAAAQGGKIVSLSPWSTT